MITINLNGPTDEEIADALEELNPDQDSNEDIKDADTQYSDYPLSNNTKARHKFILKKAHDILEQDYANESASMSLRELAKKLSALAGCHYETAKRNLAKAAHMKRYPDWIPPQRGGKRKNATGRPKKESA